MIHRVSVYTKAGVMTHVQSTNGDEWPRDVKEMDAAGVIVPLRRIDVELEPTAAEIEQGENGRPKHRKASDLFQDELEYDAPSDRIRYRAGAGRDGAITPRVAR